MKKTITQVIQCAMPALIWVAVTGCNGPGGATPSATGSTSVATDGTHTPATIPTSAKDPGPGNPPAPPTPGVKVVGQSCTGGDANHLCVALKYVGYNDNNGAPTVNQSDAISNVQAISQEWAQCNIGFQIEEYGAINPSDLGLNYSPANSTELDPIRTALSNDTTMLVVTTGTWDRSGSLGSTGANAWTNMPGDNLYGAILEAPVSTFPLIIAHELGHYMNLAHVSDAGDLMNPIIYGTSTNLTTDQCSNARSAVNYFWQKMKR